MKKSLLRYEVLFPLQFNDGSDVPEEWHAEASKELLDKFDAASCESQVIKGMWRHAGIVYHMTWSDTSSILMTLVRIAAG